jgi:hypothetical protein
MARKRPGTPCAERKECLADLAIGDRIVRKADGGCRPKVIREIPEKPLNNLLAERGQMNEERTT